MFHRRKKRKLKNLLSQVFVVIQVTCALVMFLRDAWVLLRHRQTPADPQMHQLQLVGGLILFPSLILWALARYQLARCCTLLPVAEELITQGIYSKFRHPIYLFGSLTMVGYFLFYGQPIGAIVCIVIVVPLQCYRASQESLALEMRFGELYQQYVKKVWL
jgi:protein-S-isoprenylcysteine O-methyltransferase Ste14